MPDLSKKDITDAVVQAIEPFAVSIQKDIQELKADMGELRDDVHELKSDSMQLREGMKFMHGRFDSLELELADIKQKLGNVVYRHELESLRERVARLEERAGLPH